MLLMRSYRQDSAKNAGDISPHSLLSRFSQHYLVAMATSLDQVQIDHLYPKCFHMVKRLWKSVQYVLRYSTEYASFLPCRTRRSHNELCHTGPKFTKFLHDIKASFTLLMCTLRQRYSIPFQNAKATNEGNFPFFNIIGCHGNVSSYREKRSRLIICTQNAFIR